MNSLWLQLNQQKSGRKWIGGIDWGPISILYVVEPSCFRTYQCDKLGHAYYLQRWVSNLFIFVKGNPITPRSPLLQSSDEYFFLMVPELISMVDMVAC